MGKYVIHHNKNFYFLKRELSRQMHDDKHCSVWEGRSIELAHRSAIVPFERIDCTDHGPG